MSALIYGGIPPQSVSSSPTTVTPATGEFASTYQLFDFWNFDKTKNQPDHLPIIRILSEHFSRTCEPVYFYTALIGMVEQKMPVTLSLLACVFILITWNPLLVHGDPDPMARPTRPKVFTSAEELRRYLDLVRDYYSLSGKARYGKRAQVLPIGENPWEVVRIPPAQAGLLALRQQQLEQLQQMESPAKHQLQREIENQQQESLQQELRQFQQGGLQPSNYLYDVMAKYYDDMQ